MHNIKIAVIGKSSAGKSAFIRSFSSQPQYINSVGNGQTTRAYAEYLFLKRFDSEFPIVEAKIIPINEFVENRITQVLDKLKKEINLMSEYNLSWIKEQFDDEMYNEQIKEILLFSEDFFDVHEFLFIDTEILNKVDLHYENFKLEINEKIDKGKNSEDELIETLGSFYKDIYKTLLNSIETKFNDTDIYIKENHLYYFRFPVNEERKELFSLLLKVNNVGNTKKSLSSIVAKIHVTSQLNSKYMQWLKDVEFDTITLIDTYGLDHSESIEKNMLIERYNKIFNKDYPEVSVAFLVEALHSTSSSDFKSAIKTIYEVKPKIMTYIIGTYIDENEDEIIDKKDWLFSEIKSFDNTPNLNGKVLQTLKADTNLKATLFRNGISKSMAEKRCEVMKKRFAPFCGNDAKLRLTDNSRIDYAKVNNVSIKSLFTSITSKEHLGDGYIEIDKILNGINNSNTVDKFANIFIEKATNRFREINSMTAPRTRGKLRQNLQNYILGFEGSTIDATWVRVFRDAFNETFTKEVTIDNKRTTLSSEWNMEGNSKIAFDEIIKLIYPYMFSLKCESKNKLNIYQSEINCEKCANTRQSLDNCIWNIFINAANIDFFKSCNCYTQVIDWLNNLHSFSSKDIDKPVSKLFKQIMSKQLILMCRERNAYIASVKLKNSDLPYIKLKREIFNTYKKNFDLTIEYKCFFKKVNKYLCSQLVTT